MCMVKTAQCSVFTSELLLHEDMYSAVCCVLRTDTIKDCGTAWQSEARNPSDSSRLWFWAEFWPLWFRNFLLMPIVFQHCPSISQLHLGLRTQFMKWGCRWLWFQSCGCHCGPASLKRFTLILKMQSSISSDSWTSVVSTPVYPSE